MKIAKRAGRLDQLEARVAKLETQVQSMGMVAAPEIPEDVREFLLVEQHQDEERPEMIERLNEEFKNIMHRNQMNMPKQGDTARLIALQRVLPWIRDD